MKTIIYTNYKSLFPELKGQQLTDQLLLKALDESAFKVNNPYVVRDDQGKPCIEGDDGKIWVSVSHSIDTFACLIAEKNCGIDIQFPKDIDYLKIAERYYSEIELQLVKEGGLEKFYLLWTRKEAYAKYLGTGLQEVLKGTQVVDREDVDFVDSMLDNGMFCSVCVGK